MVAKDAVRSSVPRIPSFHPLPPLTGIRARRTPSCCWLSAPTSGPMNCGFEERPTSPCRSPGTRGSAARPIGSGTGWQDGSDPSNPSFVLPRFAPSCCLRDKLRPCPGDVKRGTTRSSGHRDGQHNIVRKYSRVSGLAPFTRRVRQRRFQPMFRRFAAGNPQGFAQRLSCTSSDSPRFFHTFCTWFSYEKSAVIPDHFSTVIPTGFEQELAGSAGTKRAKNRRRWRCCGKIGVPAGGGGAAENDPHVLRTITCRGACTTSVARGTFTASRPSLRHRRILPRRREILRRVEERRERRTAWQRPEGGRRARRRRACAM